MALRPEENIRLRVFSSLSLPIAKQATVDCTYTSKSVYLSHEVATVFGLD